MLAVCAGLTKDDGTGGIADLFTKAVDMLAVGLHIQLLQVRRKTAERLGIG